MLEMDEEVWIRSEPPVWNIYQSKNLATAFKENSSEKEINNLHSYRSFTDLNKKTKVKLMNNKETFSGRSKEYSLNYDVKNVK